jgi:hypothetical protein
MPEQDKPEVTTTPYPLGRGYGHDLMRGGEVFGGYGYADRPEYELRRGDCLADTLAYRVPADPPTSSSA